jgi:hypothetical protein
MGDGSTAQGNHLNVIKGKTVDLQDTSREPRVEFEMSHVTRIDVEKSALDLELRNVYRPSLLNPPLLPNIGLSCAPTRKENLLRKNLTMNVWPCVLG